MPITYPLKTNAERRTLFLASTRPYKPTDGSRGSWARRLDDAGRVIEFKNYGTKKEGGWEIDHIKPKVKRGSNKSSNLRALAKIKNRQKGGAEKDPFENGRKKREKAEKPQNKVITKAEKPQNKVITKSEKPQNKVITKSEKSQNKAKSKQPQTKIDD